MSTKRTEGPRVTVRMQCFDCVHCVTESYQVQGDSGCIVKCAHADGREIGDSTWTTPGWCPLLPAENPDTKLLRRHGVAISNPSLRGPFYSDNYKAATVELHQAAEAVRGRAIALAKEGGRG